MVWGYGRMYWPDVRIFTDHNQWPFAFVVQGLCEYAFAIR